MIIIKCDNCGAEIERSQWRLDNYKSHFCSNKCKDEFSIKPKELRICLFCGKEVSCYPSSITKFCSNECYLKYNKEHNNKIKRMCEWCSKEFIIRADFAKGNNGRFCSRKCFSECRKNETHTTVICENCKKEFSCLRSRMRRFCSNECRYIANRGENNYGWKGGDIEKICKECGAEFMAKRNGGKSDFCSRDCYYKFNIGKNHPSYNIEIPEKEREDRRLNSEHKKWSASVKKRDDFICQKCGQKGGKLVSHHILGYRDNIGERTNLNNGIALCKKCHKQFHHLYGYKYFTKENFYEFIDKIYHFKGDIFNARIYTRGNNFII